MNRCHSPEIIVPDVKDIELSILKSMLNYISIERYIMSKRVSVHAPVVSKFACILESPWKLPKH